MSYDHDRTETARQSLLMALTARNKTGVALAALIGAAAALGGCVSNDPFAPPTDPESAAAVQISEAVARSRAYPRWRDFPAAPTGVPAPSQFAARVEQTEAARIALARAAAGLEWTLEDTQGFASATRRLVDPDLAAPVPPDAAARTEAFAAETRARAVPPPVAK